MKFKEKATVEAIQFTGTNHAEVALFVGAKNWTVKYAWSDEENRGHCDIATSMRWEKGSVGNEISVGRYVVKDRGRIDHHDAMFFLANYEACK